jgi:predicted RNA-binding Zn-ribbon protein involved in translation (DUF1610 family)
LTRNHNEKTARLLNTLNKPFNRQTGGFMIRCTSCKKELTNESGVVRFICPNCGKFEIIRCKDCRNLGIKYECPECGFTGPN